MLVGQFDRVAPADEIEELQGSWGGARFACYPQGHVGYTLMPESFRIAQEIWAADFAQGTSATSPVSNEKDEAMDAA